MKRIVILIDGTWNDERRSDLTNVAKLDSNNRERLDAFIKPRGNDGTEQIIFYHDGVGTEGKLLERILGGAIGLGLKRIVQDAYTFLADKFTAGDEVYILGFSRGAYAARALAGLIGASGIQRRPDGNVFEIAWSHYRVKPKVRSGEERPGSGDNESIVAYHRLVAIDAFHKDRAVKCVAVWDTVGSYGIPAGFGLAPLARYIALAFLGFHDTHFGNQIDVGLHAVAIDERRRPFVPTFWTIAKGHKPRGHVEQTWFAGVHCSVGGGYADARLSDRAMIWIVARLLALTALEFDVSALKAAAKPNIDGDVPDSSLGWPVSRIFPHSRVVLSSDAIHHGVFFNTRESQEEHINERVHWSVLAKQGRPCNYFGVPNTPYLPLNLRQTIPRARVADVTPEERMLGT
jgi:uncharacterized protein (DUF2235 family)